jgi:hypothetical protein
MRQCAGLHSLCACAMRTLLNSSKCSHQIACVQPIVGHDLLIAPCYGRSLVTLFIVGNISHKMQVSLQVTDMKSRPVAAPWQIALQHATTEPRSHGFTGHLETIQEILGQSSNGRLTASQLPL